MKRQIRETEVLACVVHGALASLHALSCLYHVRRGKTSHALVHAAACAYDLHGAWEHHKASKGGRK